MYIVFLCLIIEPIPQYDDCMSVVRQWFSLQEPGKPPARDPQEARQRTASDLPEICRTPAGNLPESRWEPAMDDFQHKEQINWISSTKLSLQLLIYLLTLA